MKIAVTSEGKDLDSKVDQRFGRAKYFIIIDTDTMNYEVVDNAAATEGGGAGVKAARTIIEKGCEALLTGNCGPNAYEVLKSGNVQVITGIKGSVREAVESFKSGRLKGNGGPNVESHHGIS